MRTRTYAAVAAVTGIVIALAANGGEKPKYGPKGAPHATSLTASHEYFRNHAAPDFWPLISHYVPQTGPAMCSVATFAAIVNAARASMPLGADDKLALQDELIQKVKTSDWARKVSADPKVRLGSKTITLAEMAEVLRDSLKLYKVEPESVETWVVADTSPESLKKLEATLAENEKSAKDFVWINFDQGKLTDDSGGGHVSPVAAYDEEKKRVLVLDVDREYYEPYWVSTADLLKSMATYDRDAGKNRGYGRVKLK